MKGPRILFVTAHCPFGEAYGAQLRTRNMARILSRLGRLDMVIFPFEPIAPEILERTRAEFDVRRVFHFSVKASGSFGARLKREFDPYSADTEGKRLSPSDEEEMLHLTADYDLIWFQGVSIPNCLGRRDWARSILDIDDVPSQFYQGKAREATGSWERLKATRKAAQWKRREKVLLERFSVMGVCSERDRRYLGGGDRIRVIPNGFDAPVSLPAKERAIPPRIGFIGTLKYGPNEEGVRWFIREVWPSVLADHPDARLRLVGSGTDKDVIEGERNVDRLGFVQDSDKEIRTWTLTIVPILVGGGTRIKIAEAFSREVPVVSTRQGAYGYVIEDGVECLLSDSAEDFARSCSLLIGNPETGDHIARRAREKFDRELSWDAIAPRVEAAVETCLGRVSAA